MKNKLNKAFTLVELIVVITILAVLATVAFISFQGYTSGSRDSVRLADLKNISKSFEINRTKDINFPLPDKKVDISASGTVFQYQGELSQNILESDLNIFDGGLDPVTKKPYGYAVNLARNKFQVIGFLENSENITNISQNTAFADNTDKYVKSSGDVLGILLDEINNEVIIQSGSLNNIDILQTADTYNLVIKQDIQTGNYEVLKKLDSINKNGLYSSCKELLDINPGLKYKNGIYTISPNQAKAFEVYCDMTTQGGGWTLIGRQLDEEIKKIEILNTVCDDVNKHCDGGLSEYLSIVGNGTQIMSYSYDSNKALLIFNLVGNNRTLINALGGNSVNINAYDVTTEVDYQNIYYNDKWQLRGDENQYFSYYSRGEGRGFLFCTNPGSCGQGPYFNFGRGLYTNQASQIGSSTDTWSNRLVDATSNYGIFFR